MKKYSKEESDKLPMIKGGRFTNVHVELLKLEVGESLLIEKGVDWVSKSTPYSLVNRFGKKHNRRFDKGRAADNRGWIVKRIA